MTGFGAAEGPVAGRRLRVEIRTVNHRYFNLSAKLPGDLSPAENMKELLLFSVSEHYSAIRKALGIAVAA